MTLTMSHSAVTAVLLAKPSIYADSVLSNIEFGHNISSQRKNIDDCHRFRFATESTLYVINIGDYDYDAIESCLWTLQATDDSLLVALTNAPSDNSFFYLLNCPIVKGFFHCADSQDIIDRGLAKILAGELWFSRRYLDWRLNLLRSKTVQATKKESVLTCRERQILALLAQGKSNNDIAEDLYLSSHTVRTHLYNLYKKISVKNRGQAIHWFARQNNCGGDEYARH
ncbi:putative csgAB operon transcriptional regulatory protein [Sinobacterium norvegicum]|uniref:CsgAB operon transcriptional regulatory protein n=1 Tax=Sinobacterium norvegicum TaxID=1641715 RepID=A0ABM9AHH6_9GAMM|nr:LuxR C-terminal-related transcriptional regulator [Sinobacterium norvegicum]CAH0992674.1 putative csgAB operon transcriptional regulatory protein [Sinobacterium norvegicum]